MAIIYGTAADYLNALSEDHTLALVPLTLAAEARGVSRAEIDRLLSLGKFEEIVVGDGRFVRAASVIHRKREELDFAGRLRMKLEVLAREHRTSFYDPVMSDVGLSCRRPDHRREIGKLLSIVGHQTHEDHGVILSVLVHQKATGRPGIGFLKEFRELAQPGWRDDDDLVDREIKRVWAFYASEIAA